jgi:hypothetical protein
MLPEQADGISADAGEIGFVTGSTTAVAAGSLTLTRSRCTLLALFSPSRRFTGIGLPLPERSRFHAAYHRGMMQPQGIIGFVYDFGREA